MSELYLIQGLQPTIPVDGVLFLLPNGSQSEEKMYQGETKLVQITLDFQSEASANKIKVKRYLT